MSKLTKKQETAIIRILKWFHLKLEHIDDPYITKISSSHTDYLLAITFEAIKASVEKPNRIPDKEDEER
ncbi:MAG: hypothetical protein MUP81_04860 [Dehalococcoidia bacterium]|nr:hypothetical protein [Dehalococcoidia bacterium]